jgi:hypothetical protein
MRIISRINRIGTTGLMLVVFGVAGQAHAERNLQVEGRFFDPTAQCLGYPQTTSERYEFKLSYQNTSLPWGTQVEIQYGLGESEYVGDGFGTVHSDWNEPGHVAFASSAPYAWEAFVSVPWPHNLNPGIDQFQFVIKVTYPDGATMFENGHTPYGHLSVAPPAFVCALSPAYQHIGTPYGF